MNQAHLHLVLTHLPIVGALVGTLTLLAGYVFRNAVVKRTALGILVFAALTAIPTFLTGEGAEETVENLPGVAENLIGRHENMASLFLWLVGALGLLSLGALIADRRGGALARGLYVAVAILAVAATGVATQVGLTGGRIRHTEIRGGATQASGQNEGDKAAGVFRGNGGEEDEENEN